jgi:hypothetical protein
MFKVQRSRFNVLSVSDFDKLLKNRSESFDRAAQDKREWS